MTSFLTRGYNVLPKKELHRSLRVDSTGLHWTPLVRVWELVSGPCQALASLSLLEH